MNNIIAKTKLLLIIGDPVDHSLSPQMHNAALDAAGLSSEFVFVAAQVHKEYLEDAVKGLRALHVAGITVTVPHKTAIMPFLDEIDETAQTIGAVNTVVNKNGKLIGYNTDYIGITQPLQAVTDVRGKLVAILGAGGAAHAAVFAAKKLGAKVVVLNRTIEHAKTLAEKFDCDFSSIEDINKIKEADIISNTTSVGLESNESPIDTTILTNRHIVFDVVYKPYETKLLTDAKAKGATIIHGTEMLLHQGLAQFELYTGVKAQINVMRKVIEENI